MLSQLDLFEQDIEEELKSTKKWMARLNKRVTKLERSLELLNQVKLQKSKFDSASTEQLKLWKG